MDYWARPSIERDQLVLINTTLADRIPDDHSVRLFWELLMTYDWAAWEAAYHGHRGQPPIHPRIVAGVLLYGLTQGIRSSRRLEWACGHAVDFMWLAEGRTPDHSTLCDFRRRFGPELKELFRHIGRLAHAMGVVRLNCVALDGTKVAACSSRHDTRTAESIAVELADLDRRLETLLAEAEAADAAESATLFGEDTAPVTSVPPALASTKARQAKLKKALACLQKRQAEGSTQTKVALADPEAPISPNKGGGFAPNHTPVLATDARHRFIVAETVMGDEPESEALLPLLDEVKATFGQAPEQALADSGFCTADNLEGVETRGVDAYIAPSGERLEGSNQSSSAQTNVVARADPRVPVANELHAALPRTQAGVLAKEAFVYDVPSDTYFCPIGRPLPLLQVVTEQRRGEAVQRRVYGCTSCDGCPLHAGCAAPSRHRRLRSLGATPAREQMAAKVHSEAGRRIYRQRMTVAESPNGILKSVLGARQFLLRGLAGVRTEWRWICTGYNLRILIPWLRRQRARVAQALAQPLAVTG